MIGKEFAKRNILQRNIVQFTALDLCHRETLRSYHRILFCGYKETNKLRGNKNEDQISNFTTALNIELNNIALNAYMLEDLYGHSLVEMSVAEPAPATALKFLGNNEKNVTVLVSNAGYAFLSDTQLSFLTKMLAACKMNTGDVAIVNLATGPTLDNVMEQLKPEKIIAFGITVHNGAPLFTVDLFRNARLLQAPSLDDLANESDEARALKGKLWSGLKNIFGIP